MSGAVVNNVQEPDHAAERAGLQQPELGPPWRANTYDACARTDGQPHAGPHPLHRPPLHGAAGGPGLLPQGPDLPERHAGAAATSWAAASARRKGFFPTELGFSERLIPTLAKLGIQWSVLGNNHFSRTLKDYPFADLRPDRRHAGLAAQPRGPAEHHQRRQLGAAGRWRTSSRPSSTSSRSPPRRTGCATSTPPRAPSPAGRHPGEPERLVAGGLGGLGHGRT